MIARKRQFLSYEKASCNIRLDYYLLENPRNVELRLGNAIMKIDY